MRFLCVYRPGTPERGGSPCPDEQAAMGQLISDMAKAGVLLGVEGCLPSSFGSRVRIDDGMRGRLDARSRRAHPRDGRGRGAGVGRPGRDPRMDGSLAPDPSP